MISVRTKMIRYLHMWKFKGCSSQDVIAYCGDKIIFTIEGKVYSGMLVEVGTKYIRIKEYPTLHKKKSYQFATGKFEIKKIDKLSVYPKCTQEINDVYCN